MLVALPLSRFSPLPIDDACTRLLSIPSFFSEQFSGKSWELLVIPYGDRVSGEHPLYQKARKSLANSFSTHGQISWLEPASWPGRGSALREGLLKSRGAVIFSYSLEQPCALEFFTRAASELKRGAELVRGNRRLAESRFDIPVRLLPVVYGRHRLGVWFNWIVRRILPLSSTDTQSGSVAMSRRLALHAFATQSSRDFLFDLELSLAAAANRMREVDLPITLHLPEEKDFRRVLFETLGILRNLPRLARRFSSGCYQPVPLPRGMTADDWGISPGVNQGILKLARMGAIRRVSLLAQGKYLRESLDELMRIPGIELGLHFNLTYGSLARSPADFLRRWMAPGKPHSRMIREVRAQLIEQLELLQKAGAQASYLDGHHHIHIFPGVLAHLSDLIRASGIKRVRLPLDWSLALTARLPLVVFSVMARRRLRALGFESLPFFYPRRSHFLDPGLMRVCLLRHPDSEIILHPAETDDHELFAIPDTYTAERVIEFQALRMLAFDSDPGDQP